MDELERLLLCVVSIFYGDTRSSQGNVIAMLLKVCWVVDTLMVLWIVWLAGESRSQSSSFCWKNIFTRETNKNVLIRLQKQTVICDYGGKVMMICDSVKLYLHIVVAVDFICSMQLKLCRYVIFIYFHCLPVMCKGWRNTGFVSMA